MADFLCVCSLFQDYSRYEKNLHVGVTALVSSEAEVQSLLSFSFACTIFSFSCFFFSFLFFFISLVLDFFKGKGIMNGNLTVLQLMFEPVNSEIREVR